MDTALVVGESLVDVVHGPGGTTEHPGGSPANVAVALSRLGRRTTLLTQYAEDRLGLLVDGHLRAEGVEVVRQEPRTGRTSVADALLGSDGTAAYEFDLAWTLRPWTPVEPPLVVHTGSLGAVVAPGADGVQQIVDGLREHSTVTYDLNVRPGAMGPLEGVRQAAFGLVGRADIVKASDEDLEHLFPGLGALEAARQLLARGPCAVVVTRGAAGATVITQALRVDVEAPRVAVVDTIGAGDSFCAAVIDVLWDLGLLGAPARGALGRLNERGWRTVLERATKVAAITVQRPGADPPSRTDLE